MAAPHGAPGPSLPRPPLPPAGLPAGPAAAATSMSSSTPGRAGAGGGCEAPAALRPWPGPEQAGRASEVSFGSSVLLVLWHRTYNLTYSISFQSTKLAY